MSSANAGRIVRLIHSREVYVIKVFIQTTSLRTLSRAIVIRISSRVFRMPTIVGLNSANSSLNAFLLEQSHPTHR